MAQNQSFSQNQKQTQKQTFRMSQLQIQAVKFLEMGSEDIRAEIYKFAAENPAVEIIGDGERYKSEKSGIKQTSRGTDFERSARKSGGMDSADAYQRAMENQEDDFESLQSHLMHQLNSMNLSGDEYELSQKLIYNLDKNGCYGSLLSPETLLDKTRPLQNKNMLERCIDRIQHMDPVGVCCRTLEESLYVQAKIAGDASELTLFLLKDHLDFLSPPEAGRVLKKVLDFRKEWHKKAFAKELPIDNISISEKEVENSINYILHLNPRPAQGYSTDTNSRYEMPDIVLKVERKSGNGVEDDFLRGIVAYDEKTYFQVKYASGVLPELRISEDFLIDKESVEAAKAFINNLQFRESTIVLQGCAIVKAQSEFFLKGPGNICVLTRRQIAESLGIHESTVSRFANKKNSKYIQTEWGLFPASYFFSSGVKASDGKNKVSAEEIKMRIQKLLSAEENKNQLSDEKLARLLQNEGINIARRTVAKYREQLGLKNSYKR